MSWMGKLQQRIPKINKMAFFKKDRDFNDKSCLKFNLEITKLLKNF